MKLESIKMAKFEPLPERKLALVLGGGEATGGGQWGLFPPYFKYTSDCIQRNSKGQVYYGEYTKEDGTIFEHCAEGVSQE